MAYPDRCVWTGVGRVVAVGDVHGDFDQFTGILQYADLIDSEFNWIGGKAHLVQLGDVLDRGADSRAVMDLIIRLEQQAPLQGGCVHFILGNHEIMVMQADLRYVHQGEIQSYGGVKEMIRALRPDGEYGRWLSEHSTAIRINNALFVHGGLSGEFAMMPLDSLNAMVRREISGDQSDASGILSSQGPVWFRGYAEDRGTAVTEELTASLESTGCDFTVIAHSVSMAGVSTRFSGRAVMIDTGMSECYGGTAQCIVLDQRGYKTLIP